MRFRGTIDEPVVFGVLGWLSYGFKIVSAKQGLHQEVGIFSSTLPSITRALSKDFNVVASLHE